MRVALLTRILIGLIIASIGLWYLLFSPLVDDLTRAQKSLAAVREQHTAEVQKVRRLELLEQQYASLGDNIERINFMLPRETGRNELLVELEALINKSGVGLQKLDINEPRQITRRSKDGGASVNKVNLKISFITTYEGIKNFLRLQERELRLMDVQKISFAPGGGAKLPGGGSFLAGVLPVFSVSVDLNAYFKP